MCVGRGRAGDGGRVIATFPSATIVATCALALATAALEVDAAHEIRLCDGFDRGTWVEYLPDCAGAWHLIGETLPPGKYGIVMMAAVTPGTDPSTRLILALKDQSTIDILTAGQTRFWECRGPAQISTRKEHSADAA